MLAVLRCWLCLIGPALLLGAASGSIAHQSDDMLCPFELTRKAQGGVQATHAVV